jgi:choline dehydrogenase-like flavoprotein
MTMQLKKVDVVIVGSGAGGAVVAKELSEAGLSVVLLERGRRYTKKDAHHDLLRSQYDNSGALGYGPAIKSNPRTFRLTPEQPAHVRYPNQGGYGRTAASVGGGTVAYGCMAWRFVPDDFRLATKYGVPPGSTVADWPITYDELEPYYTKAEYEIGISGQAGANPFDPHRSKPYPLPPIPFDRPAQVFARGARKLGLHPFPLPLAILTAPYDGRLPCIRCLHCERFQCEVDAKSSMHATMIPKAEATKRCEVRTECMAREVLVDSRGRARGVAYFDKERTPREQPADLVVVSCNASESARLLLNSKSRLFPDGVANRTGQVGRHILDHTGGATIVGYFQEEIFEPLGPAFNAGCADYVHRGGAVLGGGVITTLAEFRSPLFFAKHAVPGLGSRPWGGKAKAFVRQYFRRALALYSPGQGLPTEQNRVDLDPTVRDAWGIPVVRLTHRAHPMDIRSSHFLRNRMIEILKAAGAIEELLPRPSTDEQIEEAARTEARGGIGEHQVGGCRMGNDPGTSVLNKYCQTHDVPNLFVVDGSCFPTIGGFNPSLTIQANAFRVSEYIVRRWKGGGLRS